jgi:hypothetical protein
LGLAATMRIYTLTIIILINYSRSFSQTADILKLSLTDNSNFRVMTTFGDRIPKKFIILNTTTTWITQTFYLDNVDLANPEIKRQMDSGVYKPYNKTYSNSYFNPYEDTYLFKDSLLNSKITESEKLKLKETALKIKPRKIELKSEKYYSVSNPNKIKGFIITLNEPIFTNDFKYAFVNFEIYHKRSKNEDFKQAYFGHSTIVYERQKDKTWKRLNCKSSYIL